MQLTTGWLDGTWYVFIGGISSKDEAAEVLRDVKYAIEERLADLAEGRKFIAGQINEWSDL